MAPVTPEHRFWKRGSLCVLSFEHNCCLGWFLHLTVSQTSLSGSLRLLTMCTLVLGFLLSHVTRLPLKLSVFTHWLRILLKRIWNRKNHSLFEITRWRLDANLLAGQGECQRLYWSSIDMELPSMRKQRICFVGKIVLLEMFQERVLWSYHETFLALGSQLMGRGWTSVWGAAVHGEVSSCESQARFAPVFLWFRTLDNVNLFSYLTGGYVYCNLLSHFEASSSNYPNRCVSLLPLYFLHVKCKP